MSEESDRQAIIYAKSVVIEIVIENQRLVGENKMLLINRKELMDELEQYKNTYGHSINSVLNGDL